MSRLWDQGEPLDARVLRYTAGEDHALDERLVPYDVRGSIAHATMLHQQKLLSAQDFDAICTGLQALAVSHAAGDWHIGLDDEDRAHRGRAPAHREDRRSRQARAPRPLA